jgi:hypothetical protein
VATSEIRSFAGASGAFVLSQAEYDLLTAVQSHGFPSGILPGVQLNKVLRQLSLVAAALAKYAANTTGTNVVDNGDVDGLVALIQLAVSTTAAGAPSGGFLPFDNVATTTYTLQPTDIGKKKRFTHASGCNVTVPTGTSLIQGFTVDLYCASVSGILTVSGGDAFNIPTGASLEATDFGSSIALHKVGAAEWDVVGDLFFA